MLKTNMTSLQKEVNLGGRSRPRRSIWACNDASELGSNVSVLFGRDDTLMAATAWTVEACPGLRLLDGTGFIHEISSNGLKGSSRDRGRVMIRLPGGKFATSQDLVVGVSNSRRLQCRIFICPLRTFRQRHDGQHHVREHMEGQCR